MPLTPTQQIVADDTNRFKVVCAGRRWGKSWLSIREMCKAASKPGKKVYYVAPTYRQAKTIIWDELVNKLTQVRWIKKVNATELTVKLKNGSSISLRSADNYESLRGISIDYLVIECSVNTGNPVNNRRIYSCCFYHKIILSQNVVVSIHC